MFPCRFLGITLFPKIRTTYCEMGWESFQYAIRVIIETRGLALKEKF
jgi:hypothetical protein